VALEWLLVVAALAGLAALAVVVVQRVVDDTAERVGASQPRWAAAALAALEVERRARAATAADPHAATWADWEGHFSARCVRLAILYRDVAVEMDAAFAAPTALGGADPISGAVLASATEGDPTGSAPQVRCNVGEPGGVVAVAAPPPGSIEEFHLAADAIVAAAAELRPGDTWRAWKAYFDPLCAGLALRYAGLGITILSEFRKPADQLDPNAEVTQVLLTEATADVAANGRPQIKCEADV